MEEREVLVVPAETNELTLEVLTQLMETMCKLSENIVGLAEQIEKVVESHESLVTMLTADERREMAKAADLNTGGVVKKPETWSGAW